MASLTADFISRLMLGASSVELFPSTEVSSVQKGSLPLCTCEDVRGPSAWYRGTARSGGLNRDEFGLSSTGPGRKGNSTSLFQSRSSRFWGSCVSFIHMFAAEIYPAVSDIHKSHG